MHCWVPLGAAGHICANFETCSLEPLTMLNPLFVAGEHGLFGGHKSEDIRTFFSMATVLCSVTACLVMDTLGLGDIRVD